MCRSVVNALHGGLPDNKNYLLFLSHERNSDLQRCTGLEVISANLVALVDPHRWQRHDSETPSDCAK